MALRFFALGTLVVLATVGVSSAVAPVQRNTLHAISPPGNARLYAVGTRSVAQRASADARKLDSVLADLSRHLTSVRPAHQLADLHSLSPAAKFIQRTPKATPLVLVDAVTRGDPQRLKAALEGLGLEHASVYANDVGGWLPITAIGSAAASAELVSIRAALPHTRGVVALQGDYVQHSALVRTDYPGITGTGITVGVLSDSFDCYAVYAAPGSGVPVSGNQGYAPNGFTADYATDQSTGASARGRERAARKRIASITARRPRRRSPTRAGQCCRSCMRSLPVRDWLSTGRGQRGRFRQRHQGACRRGREGHRRRPGLFRRALLSGRIGRRGHRYGRSAAASRISPRPATTRTFPTRTPPRASRPRAQAPWPAITCSISTPPERPTPPRCR